MGGDPKLGAKLELVGLPEQQSAPSSLIAFSPPGFINITSAISPIESLIL